MNSLTRLSCAGAAFAVLLSGCRATGGEPDRGVVVTCESKLGLDAKDAARQDWSGETRLWVAEAKDDTLRLSRQRRCGDECNVVEEIVLAGLEGACPTFVRASTTRHESGSPVKNATKVVDARHGSLQIQDWHPIDGVVSGRLTSEFKTTFYVNLAKEP